MLHRRRPPLADAEVFVYEVFRSIRTTGGRTGDDGAGHDHPPASSASISPPRRRPSYVLQADSPVDGSTRCSDELTATGRCTFIVGNGPLRVTVVNGVAGRHRRLRVTVTKCASNDKWRWTTWSATDERRRGLRSRRSRRRSRLRPRRAPVPRGRSCRRGPIRARQRRLPRRHGTGRSDDGDTSLPLVGPASTPRGIGVHARRRTTRRRTTTAAGCSGFKHTITDENGGMQLMSKASIPPTPAAPSSGRLYVFVAWTPFGVDEGYFRCIVDARGPVLFRSPVPALSARCTPPSCECHGPSTAPTSTFGIAVSGFAGDDATLDQRRRHAHRSGVGRRAGRRRTTRRRGVGLTVRRAMTRSASRSRSPARLRSAHNAIVRHPVGPCRRRRAAADHLHIAPDGDSVEKTGFLLSGTATDDVGVTSLVATVDDPVLGRSVNQQPVAVAGDGRWTLAVLNGRLTRARSSSPWLAPATPMRIARGRHQPARRRGRLRSPSSHQPHYLRRHRRTARRGGTQRRRGVPGTATGARKHRRLRLRRPDRRCAGRHQGRPAALCAAARRAQPPPAARGDDAVLGQPLQHRHQQAQRGGLRAGGEQLLPPDRRSAASATSSRSAPPARRCCSTWTTP